MTSDFAHPEITPDARLEFANREETAGATCALLTPAINARLRELNSGQILEVLVNDPSAKEDIYSWSRLSGNPVVGMFDEPQALRFYLRKK